MNKKEKEMIVKIVENMKQMDSKSLTIMKSNSDILKARDDLEKEEIIKEVV